MAPHFNFGNKYKDQIHSLSRYHFSFSPFQISTVSLKHLLKPRVFDCWEYQYTCDGFHGYNFSHLKKQGNSISSSFFLFLTSSKRKTILAFTTGQGACSVISAGFFFLQFLQCILFVYLYICKITLQTLINRLQCLFMAKSILI